MWVCGKCAFDGNVDEFEECMHCGAQRGEEHSAVSELVPQPVAQRRIEAAPVWAVPESSRIPSSREVESVCQPSSGAQVQTSGPSGKTILVLTESKTGEKINIDAMSCVIGREGDYRPEIFSDRVSREQLEINCDDGSWTVCQIGSTNPSGLITRTGRIALEYGLQYPVHSGDRLRLANQTFLVSIEAAEEEQTESDSADVDSTVKAASENTETLQTASDTDEREGWFITCGRCGSVFQVADGESKMSECPNCIDIMDKREIGRVAPMFGRKSRNMITDVR